MGSTSSDFCIQGVCIQGGLHLWGFWAAPPLDTMGYGQRMGCMHPTGMHSCSNNNFILASKCVLGNLNFSMCDILPKDMATVEH